MAQPPFSLLLKKNSSSAKVCALVGCNPCWLAFCLVACPWCLCPHGVTSIWLVVSRVACSSVGALVAWQPLSQLLFPQTRFWTFSNSWWTQRFYLCSMMAMLPSILSIIDQQHSKEHNTCPHTLIFDAHVFCHSSFIDLILRGSRCVSLKCKEDWWPSYICLSWEWDPLDAKHLAKLSFCLGLLGRLSIHQEHCPPHPQCWSCTIIILLIVTSLHCSAWTIPMHLLRMSTEYLTLRGTPLELKKQFGYQHSGLLLCCVAVSEANEVWIYSSTSERQTKCASRFKWTHKRLWTHVLYYIEASCLACTLYL